MRFFLRYSLITSLSLAACGGEVADSSTPGGGGESTERIQAAQALCAASPLSVVETKDDAAQQLMVGRWRRCGEPQIAGEDLGVEFTADGHYYPLYRDENGKVQRRQGIDFVGQWAYYPPGVTVPALGGSNTRGSLFVNGAYTDPAILTAEPRQMRVQFTPVPSRYIPLDE